MEYRIERDSMGEVRVPADRYWGAQTQRSHENFPIGVGIETMPMEIIRAFAVLKKAAAIANRELLPERMSAEKCALIGRVCDEILAGELDGHFPLVVWQTGSGTQSNMNSNEVIANRGNEIAGKKLLHPNDDVNMSQSSNDTFPTAMHIAACLAVEDRLLPAVSALEQTLLRLEAENADVLKSGRTHLQDATPIAFSQEISGWRGMLENSLAQVKSSCEGLYRLALGGTAVGTGLNAPEGFAELAARKAAELTGFPFVTDPNKFHALTAKDDLAFSHGALKALAANLMKRGPENVVVTGIHFRDAKDGVVKMGNLAVSGGKKSFSAFPYIGGSYSGTGDLFASVVAAGMARGDEISASIELAGAFIERAITDSVREGIPRNDGVDYEQHLGMLLPKQRQNREKESGTHEE